MTEGSAAGRHSDPRPLSKGQALAIGAIRFYQATLSRVLPPSCRFYPSCSEYARQAIERYGVIRGVWMGTKRLARCHPFNPGGYDPVR